MLGGLCRFFFSRGSLFLSYFSDLFSPIPLSYLICSFLLQQEKEEKEEKEKKIKRERKMALHGAIHSQPLSQNDYDEADMVCFFFCCLFLLFFLFLFFVFFFFFFFFFFLANSQNDFKETQILMLLSDSFSLLPSLSTSFPRSFGAPLWKKQCQLK